MFQYTLFWLKKVHAFCWRSLSFTHVPLSWSPVRLTNAADTTLQVWIKQSCGHVHSFRTLRRSRVHTPVLFLNTRYGILISKCSLREETGPGSGQVGAILRQEGMCQRKARPGYDCSRRRANARGLVPVWSRMVGWSRSLKQFRWKSCVIATSCEARRPSRGVARLSLLK